MRTLLLASLLLAVPSFASADNKLHVSTDIVTWDKPLTEAQCLDKGKTAILAVDSKLTTATGDHAWTGTKDSFVAVVDCLQSYKLNGAYVTVIHNGTDDAKQVIATIIKSLGGTSEMHH